MTDALALAEPAPASLSAQVRAAFSPSGGVYWHLAAWRQHTRQWAPFRKTLTGWLDGWRPPQRHLLLVGPSAGWMLDRRLLQRFERITAVDPDPLAPRLFARRFRHLPVHWSRIDYFGPTEAPLQLARIDALCAAYPDAAILFCNVLSQLTALYPRATGATADPPQDTPEFAAWKQRLGARLGERSWASFHDRLSSARAPDVEFLGLDAELPALELAGRCFEIGPDSARDVYDHQLGGIAPHLPRHLVHWPRRREMHHLVELLSEVRP